MGVWQGTESFSSSASASSSPKTQDERGACQGVYRVSSHAPLSNRPEEASRSAIEVVQAIVGGGSKAGTSWDRGPKHTSDLSVHYEYVESRSAVWTSER
jgi:hypothetical protein